MGLTTTTTKDRSAAMTGTSKPLAVDSHLAHFIPEPNKVVSLTVGARVLFVKLYYRVRGVMHMMRDEHD